MKILREHFFPVLIVGILLLGLFYYLIVVSPAFAKRDSLSRFIKKRESTLREMIEQKRRWESFLQERLVVQEAMKGRDKGFTLLGFLEGVSREAGIEQKIKYMKPLTFQNGVGQLKQEGIEVGLEEIGIEQLVELLQRIEYSGKLLQVNRIKIQRTEREKGKKVRLKVAIQVNTFTPS